jgi:hypothetical protein
MRRLMARLGVGLFVLSVGCNTAASDQWRWPWVKPSPLAEQYNVPPVDDERYSDPQQLPKSVMKPGLKPQDIDPKRPPAGMGGPPGMMPGARPGGAPGNFMY